MEFDDRVPATQLESALAKIWKEFNITDSLTCDVIDSKAIQLLPKFFNFSDLATIPLSLIHRSAIASTDKSKEWLIGSHPFTVKSHIRRRGKIFLRYLVGHHIITKDKTENVNPERNCVYLKRIIKNTVENHINLSCSVEANFGGRFYEPLYTGMWLYQMRRLEEILTDIFLDQATCDPLKAIISVLGQRSDARLEIRFNDDTHSFCNERTYLLNLRPAEDHKRCITRVKAKTVENVMNTRQSSGSLVFCEGVKNYEADVSSMRSLVFQV